MKSTHRSAKAAARISAAHVEGATPGSQSLRFEPGEIKRGQYDFDIGTAGSVSLLLQTLCLPLSFAEGPSGLTLTGGTHVPRSPCFHYLQRQWLPYLAEAGYHVACTLERAGFYPCGGGVLPHQRLERHIDSHGLRAFHGGRPPLGLPKMSTSVDRSAMSTLAAPAAWSIRANTFDPRCFTMSSNRMNKKGRARDCLSGIPWSRQVMPPYKSWFGLSEGMRAHPGSVGLLCGFM